MENHVVMLHGNSVFSLTWPASMHIYWNKRKHLHKKLPQDWFWEVEGGGGGGEVEVQLPYPRATPKLHFPVNQLKMS